MSRPLTGFRRSSAIVGCLGTLVVLLSFYILYAITCTYDLVIIGARIHDGSGDSGFTGGVAIRHDRIAAVWTQRAWRLHSRSRLTLDGAGLDLTPGFIDTHSHADLGLNASRPIRAANFVAQGVTTVVVGNCGRSAQIAALQSQVRRHGSDINIAPLIGFNSVRAAVVGNSPTAADGAQIDQIREIVRAGMEAGAFGVSTGLAYVPGVFTPPAETLAALGVAAEYGGIHATHIRNEGSQILESVREVVDLSAEVRIPLLISHLKITGRSNCGKFPALLETLTDASRRLDGGLYFDQYPYDSSSTNLEIYLPGRYLSASQSERRRMLSVPAERLRLKEEIRSAVSGEGFTDLEFIRIAAYSPRREWQGRTIAAIDRQRRLGGSTIDTQLDVVLQLLMGGDAQLVYRNICPDVMNAIPASLPVMIGSDSGVRTLDDTTLHPRGWGTFPRVLRTYVREQHTLPFDQAIYRMTGLPHLILALKDRGLIRPGYFADLVLLNGNDILDRADYDHPSLPPSGVKAVWVNGQPVAGDWRGMLSAGPEARLPGRVLRRGRASRPRVLLVRPVPTVAPVAPAATGDP